MNFDDIKSAIIALLAIVGALYLTYRVLCEIERARSVQ